MQQLCRRRNGHRTHDASARPLICPHDHTAQSGSEPRMVPARSRSPNHAACQLAWPANASIPLGKRSMPSEPATATKKSERLAMSRKNCLRKNSLVPNTKEFCIFISGALLTSSYHLYGRPSQSFWQARAQASQGLANDEGVLEMASYLSTGWWSRGSRAYALLPQLFQSGIERLSWRALDDPRTFDELAVAWSRFSKPAR